MTFFQELPFIFFKNQNMLKRTQSIPILKKEREEIILTSESDDDVFFKYEFQKAQILAKNLCPGCKEIHDKIIQLICGAQSDEDDS